MTKLCANGKGRANCAESLALLQKGQRNGHYVRDANLKDIVLDQLLPQHDDAELDAQLHETASRSTLQWGEQRDRSGQPTQALEQ